MKDEEETPMSADAHARGEKLIEDHYLAVRNEWGIVTHYKGETTGQLVGKWLSEATE